MRSVGELKRWLSTMEDDDDVAIDDEGMSLVHVRDDELSGLYIEIGGVPDWVE